MTKELIIITIATGIISAFATVIFDKLLTPFVPDKKKLTLYFRKVLRFILVCVPIASIIILMTLKAVVTKYFVFAMATNFLSLSIIFNYYIVIAINKRFIKVYELIGKTAENEYIINKKDIEIFHSLNQRIKALEEKQKP